ncbi:restriction endonuclease subunit S [Gelidibacter gilvus]|uniref:Restriction endonuclease subunit S n=1 Tax=Gelidibacter gilvus TaxID=59602 RepID=A0A4Q0XL85_9FLAO|nr:restriction endonuclease subunit S [Gelidibacter gilvus]RXJ51089.1 restriction endonuclease subunit S [Gelidibacter gilvus]
MKTFLKDIIAKPITGEWGTDGDEVNVLRTTNFTNSGVLDLSNVVKRNIAENKVKQKQLLRGDIIIEKSGGSPTQPVGRVVFFEEEGVYLCNNFTSVLRPKKDRVEPKYLHYLLYANHRFGVTEMFQNKTTGIINLQLTRYVNKLEIPLPPLKTQQRIAQILDDATALRDKTKQLLTEYDLLAQSIFLEMFGDPVINPKQWEKRLLNDICGVGSSRRVFVNELVDEGIPFYRGKEIGELSVGKPINPDLFITEDHYNVLKEATGVPKIGHLLMPSICPDGRILRIETEDPFYFKDGRVLWIKVNESNINSYYLTFFLRELFRTNYYNIASGTTFAELKIVALKKIKTIVPPIDIQNQFADKITLIEQQKELAQQELKESEDLFNCLLQKAFKGELV